MRSEAYDFTLKHQIFGSTWYVVFIFHPYFTCHPLIYRAGFLYMDWAYSSFRPNYNFIGDFSGKTTFGTRFNPCTAHQHTVSGLKCVDFISHKMLWSPYLSPVFSDSMWPTWCCGWSGSLRAARLRSCPCSTPFFCLTVTWTCSHHWPPSSPTRASLMKSTASPMVHIQKPTWSPFQSVYKLYTHLKSLSKEAHSSVFSLK